MPSCRLASAAAALTASVEDCHVPSVNLPITEVDRYYVTIWNLLSQKTALHEKWGERLKQQIVCSGPSRVSV